MRAGQVGPPYFCGWNGVAGLWALLQGEALEDGFHHVELCIIHGAGIYVVLVQIVYMAGHSGRLRRQGQQDEPDGGYDQQRKGESKATGEGGLATCLITRVHVTRPSA